MADEMAVVPATTLAAASRRNVFVQEFFISTPLTYLENQSVYNAVPSSDTVSA
jgi:hypothetical protein